MTTEIRYAVTTPKIRWLERGRIAAGVGALIFAWLLTSPIDRIHTGSW